MARYDSSNILRIVFIFIDFQVVDVFLSSTNLGHETADILTEKILESLQSDSLHLERMLALSKDDCAVMKCFTRKLIVQCEEAGNPKILDCPDYLHPMHTSLKKGLKDQPIDADKFLVNIHGFFKLSTARRWDQLEIREKLDNGENSQFFRRHVSTRWLTMGPVTEIVVDHWESLREFFLKYIPDKNDQASREAMETLRYREIVEVLKDSKHRANLARLKFIIFLCKQTDIFLKTFQSEKPMIHKLYSDSVKIVRTLMGLVCQSDAIPNAGYGSRFERVDFEDEDDVLLPLLDCNVGHRINDEIRLLGTESRKQLRVECRKVVITMVKYLISHLPLKNSFLKDLSYFNPNLRQEASFIPSLMRVAKEVGRFTDQEMTDISSQLNMVKTLQGIPEYSDETHSMDHFMIGVVAKMVEL